MRMKTLIVAILISVSFLAMPHAAYSQKNGEAQAVIVDKDKRLILKFTNKEVDWQRCAFLVGNKSINQEQAFVLRVAHLHHRFQMSWGRRPVLQVGGLEVEGVSLPEQGWLYITPSRIVFAVEEGDKSHAFDVSRTDLKNKPVTALQDFLPTGVQINLKERLPASDSRE